MNEFEFTLVLSGDFDDDRTMDALFVAGCDDATFGSVDGAGLADFVRGAPSLAMAVKSAIDQVESVPGLRVLRVEPDEFVTMSEIAERLGRSRESVRLLVKGQRGPGGFPHPVSHLRARSRLWRWSEVAAWAAQNLGSASDEGAHVIASVNAVLAFRENASKLAPEERKLVESLT